MAPTIVLISGANRGLGKALLERYLAKDDHAVIAAVRDLNHPTSQDLKEVPKGKQSRLIVVKVDSSVESDPFKAVEELSAQGIDHIDLVIANAGIAQAFPTVAELKVADLQTHITPNVFGVVWLYQATIPLLRKSTGPKWVTMGSSAGQLENQPPIPNAAYGPSKAAVHWLTKRINAEEDSLTAFVLHPGFVQTEMGNSSARLFGLEKADITVDESCDGTVRLIDVATKESHGGKLWDNSGTLLTW
ncbi:hypothetical protein Daus18300_007982 [Diaporthe australafricana]|uniref:Aflatoxin biosynthesis ketoreductase nor-1 n=1 Tax=Diaporthe australafricana TaxID=127596 RepID=A0ABR3WK39_9PEZI